MKVLSHSLILIGNEVVVGSGAVVTKSFEGSHINLGVIPAKIISQKGLL